MKSNIKKRNIKKTKKIKKQKRSTSSIADTTVGKQQRIQQGKKFRKKSIRTKKKTIRKRKKGGNNNNNNKIPDVVKEVTNQVITNMKQEGEDHYHKWFASEFYSVPEDYYLWDDRKNSVNDFYGYYLNPNYIAMNPDFLIPLDTLNREVNRELLFGLTDYESDRSGSSDDDMMFN
jgi:hypothetical protein